MPFATVDLCDQFRASIQVALPVFRSYGGKEAFSGQIETARCFEDNVILKELLAKPGAGKVLVVDAGGSLRKALVGDKVAALAAQSGWAGVVLNGCVRDLRGLATCQVGLFALGHVPLASDKLGWGTAGGAVQFAGVTFTPGHYLYADQDGLVVLPTAAT